MVPAVPINCGIGKTKLSLVEKHATARRAGAGVSVGVDSVPVPMIHIVHGSLRKHATDRREIRNNAKVVAWKFCIIARDCLENLSSGPNFGAESTQCARISKRADTQPQKCSIVNS